MLFLSVDYLNRLLSHLNYWREEQFLEERTVFGGKNSFSRVDKMT